MEQFSRICAYIDLDAVEFNIENEKKNISKATKMMAVIKTDGYGHGAAPIAKVLEPKEYMWGFATATLEEAVSLKKEGICKPILVLGCIFPEQYEAMIDQEVRATVYTWEMAKAMSDKAVKMNAQVYFHIKLDTGMGRIGFAINEESADLIERISQLPNVVMEGMFTHFAKADMSDHTYTHEQYAKFSWMKQQMEERKVTILNYHCDNSAGIIDFPEMCHDIVRSGITTYGLYPSAEVSRDVVSIRPVMSLISHVTYVKEIEAGTSISYGGTFVADQKMRVATIPVGYGDGYPRSLSNKGYVLIHSKKAKILGRVCMDQFMADVTGIPETVFGSEVTLIGTDGNETITAEMLGDLSGRFNYELTCCINKRVPRVYLKNDEVRAIINYVE
ncbi:MAG: alanine racemase [Hespellia sp.]|nr:alanine racemase [Hespellia sp.]